MLIAQVQKQNNLKTQLLIKIREYSNAFRMTIVWPTYSIANNPLRHGCLLVMCVGNCQGKLMASHHTSKSADTPFTNDEKRFAHTPKRDLEHISCQCVSDNAKRRLCRSSIYPPNPQTGKHTMGFRFTRFCFVWNWIANCKGDDNRIILDMENETPMWRQGRSRISIVGQIWQPTKSNWMCKIFTNWIRIHACTLILALGIGFVSLARKPTEISSGLVLGRFK